MLKKLLEKFFPLRKELPGFQQEISTTLDPALTLELQKQAPKLFAFFNVEKS
jgi:hypothetical protein